MTRIELIYDRDCPNVSKARAQLLRAFADAGISPQWTEWDRGDPACPAYMCGYGSPTILVDGNDVAGAELSDGISCCRLYTDAAGGFQGVPSVQLIVSALRLPDEGPISAKRAGLITGWPQKSQSRPCCPDDIPKKTD